MAYKRQEDVSKMLSGGQEIDSGLVFRWVANLQQVTEEHLDKVRSQSVGWRFLIMNDKL